MELMRKTENSGLLLFLMGILCVLTVPIFAQADGNNVDEKAYVNPGNMFPDVKDIDGDPELTKQRDQYLAERGWELSVNSANPGNAYIGWASAPIKVEPDDVRYGEARIAAFHTAFASAKGELALVNMRVYFENTLEFMLDELPEDRPIRDELAYLRDRIDIAAEKGIDLGEAHLDKLLRDFEIDPGNYRKASRAEAKQLLKAAFTRNAVMSATRSMRGLRVLTTFENLRSVGVLVIYSHELENIARQCVLGEAVSRRPAEVVTASIQDMIAETLPDDASYIPVHGVRIMEDDAGQNVLVAFGQAAPAITKTTSNRLAQARMRAARMSAQLEAAAALTAFVNGHLEIKQTGNDAELEDIRNIMEDISIREMESYEIGNRMDKFIKENGRADWEGVTTIKTWTANNPRTGHPLVGHVLMWSPSTRDLARGKFLKQDEVKRAERVKYDDEVIVSPSFDHLDPTLRRKK